MGKYITEIPTSELKEAFKASRGHYPSWLGEAFGYLGERNIYNLTEQFSAFADAIIPDYFPFGTVQGFLIGIFQSAYKVLAVYYYGDYADKGDQLVLQFDRMTNDYIQKIEATRTKLEATLATADAWIRDHEKRIKQLERHTGLPIQMPEFQLLKKELK